MWYSQQRKSDILHKNKTPERRWETCGFQKKYLEMKETIQDLKNDKKILQTVCEKYKNDLEKKPATIYIREPYPE